MARKKQKENKPEDNLPVPIIDRVLLTRENLVKLLEDGAITLHEAGEHLELTEEQIKFVELFTGEYSGDAFLAACEVHNLNPSNRRQKEEANRIARNYTRHRDIILLINATLTLGGFNDQAADRNLNFLMQQKADLKVSLAATKVYAEQTQRIQREEAENRKRKLDWSKLTTQQLESLLSLAALAEVTNEGSLLTQYLPPIEFKDVNGGLGS